MTCRATSVGKVDGSPRPVFAPRSLTMPLSFAVHVPTIFDAGGSAEHVDAVNRLWHQISHVDDHGGGRDRDEDLSGYVAISKMDADLIGDYIVQMETGDRRHNRTDRRRAD
jgi:hypothetical protein